MKKNQSKIKFRTKLIALLLLLFSINIAMMVLVAFNVGKENSLNRMNIEFREEARTMATVWLYRSGGKFLMESGVPMTADGEILQKNIISYFERWASLNSTKNIMTVIMKDNNGWRRICSSATDLQGNSLAGTYIDDPRIIQKLEEANEVDYTGDETVGGKDYIISYSFFYKADDTGEIPFALGIGEDLKEAYEEINHIIFKNLIIAIIINLVAFGGIFLLILKFVKNDITKKVQETTMTLRGASEQVAMKADQFSRAGSFITMDSKRQAETVSDVKERFITFGEEYNKFYDEIIKATKLSDNLYKVVEKGDLEASSLYERVNSAKAYVNESNSAVEKLREWRKAEISEELKYNIDKIIDIVDTVGTKLDDGTVIASTVSNIVKTLLLDVNSMKISTYELKSSAEAQVNSIRSVESSLMKLQDSTNEQKEKAAENIETGTAIKDEIKNVTQVIDDLKNI